MLSASMVRGRGWLVARQMVIIDPVRVSGADGLQLINGWPNRDETYRSATGPAGSIEDFIGAFADWHFDWSDVPAFIRRRSVLEFSMVDQVAAALELRPGNVLGDAGTRWCRAAPMEPARRSWTRRPWPGVGSKTAIPVAALARMRSSGSRLHTHRSDHAPIRDAIPARGVQRTNDQRSPRSRTSSPRRASGFVGRLQADSPVFEGCFAP